MGWSDRRMTYNAASRKDIRFAEKAQAELRRAHLEFLTACMNTLQGRSWFYHLLESCQCFVDVPTFEPHKDYFDHGRKSVGLPLMADLQTHCPNQYLQMMAEENVRLAAATERTSRQNPGRDLEGRDDSVSTGDPDQPELWGPDDP